jgi:hypothetical protein
MHMKRAILLALLLTACGPVPLDGDEVLVVFVDPDTDFETTDVFDVERDVVHFTDAGRMIHADADLAFPGWPASGNNVGRFGEFRIRFGDDDGERRAFFTEADPPTICDIEVEEEDELRVYSTSQLVPTGG